MKRTELEEALSVAKHRSEGNSSDFAGGVESEDRTEQLHAWTDFAARMGSKLAEAFYVKRLGAVVVTRTEEPDGEVVYSFDAVEPFEPLDVDDLAERLRNAERELKELSVDAAVAGRDSEAARLRNKAAGVGLALSYVQEMSRG